MIEESRVPFETQPTGLETAPAPLESRPPREVSLFWRTFFLLAMLLVGCIIAWLQTFRALEFEPRVLQSAQQLASLVNLSRAALIPSPVSVNATTSDWSVAVNSTCSAPPLGIACSAFSTRLSSARGPLMKSRQCRARSRRPSSARANASCARC